MSFGVAGSPEPDAVGKMTEFGDYCLGSGAVDLPRTMKLLLMPCVPTMHLFVHISRGIILYRSVALVGIHCWCVGGFICLFVCFYFENSFFFAFFKFGTRKFVYCRTKGGSVLIFNIASNDNGISSLEEPTW